jgi:uncharacterized membrane protein YgcG
MVAMKRTAAVSVFLLLGAFAALAEPTQPRRFSNRLLSDVVQMTRAGLSDETIIAYVQARRIRLDADVSADDLIRLRQAGVTENVVRYIAGAAHVEESSSGPSREMTYDSGGTAYPVEPSYTGDGPYPYSYAYGYPYWYGWLGDPYWYGYGPYFSTGFFVGGRQFFHGRSFDHRGSGHGSGGHHGGSGGHHGGSGGHNGGSGGHRGSGGHGLR